MRERLTIDATGRVLAVGSAQENGPGESHYIAGTLRGHCRSISPMFDRPEKALAWLEGQKANPAFVKSWQGGSFELVTVLTKRVHVNENGPGE